MSRAARARLAAGCVAIAVLAVLAAADESPWVARISAQARERIVYASALDANTRQPVPNLGPDAFVVREDDVRREVLRVAPAKTPMPVAILVDNSQAAAPAIADLRKALTAFLSAMDGIGPVAIFSVADRPTLLSDYTTSQSQLQAAVQRLFHVPGSGATLLEGINDVAKGLGRRESDRAAIVVVTTENVEFSQLYNRNVLDSLRTSGAALHAVVLTNPGGSLSTEEARERATVLDRGPRESGGFRFDVLSSMAFEVRLLELAAALKSQYQVVYARPEALIPPEKIEVSSGKPGLDVRGGPARGQGKP